MLICPVANLPKLYISIYLSIYLYIYIYIYIYIHTRFQKGFHIERYIDRYIFCLLARAPVCIYTYTKFKPMWLWLSLPPALSTCLYMTCWKRCIIFEVYFSCDILTWERRCCSSSHWNYLKNINNAFFSEKSTIKVCNKA